MVQTPHRPIVAFVSAAMVLVALAGCIDPGTDDGNDDADATSVDLGTFVNPMLQDHDHSDPDLHDLSWNMVRTGGSLLDMGTRGYAAPHAIDIQADLMFVSAYAATGDAVAGVYIFDLSVDPADPPLLGKWLTEGPAGGDRNMEATSDGAFVVVSYESNDCAGNVGPHNTGMYLIDTSDPTNPVEADRVIIEPGDTAAAEQHSITIWSSDEGDYVYHGAGSPHIYRIDRGAKTLEPVGTFASGHDSSIYIDPLTDTPWLLSADVSAFNIYDITDPTSPAVLGTWPVPKPESYYVHTAIAAHLDGRNIAIVNSEDFRQDPSAFWVLDITDPAAPTQLAQWTSPDDVPSGDLTFSLHNPRFEDGILTFSYYHAGIWQFDLNDPAAWTAPEPRAYLLPTEPIGRAADPDGTIVMSKVCGLLLDGPTTIPPGSGATGGSLDILFDSVPFTFDVEVQGGYVYAADVNTGVHVLRFEPGAGTMGHDDETDDP